MTDGVAQATQQQRLETVDARFKSDIAKLLTMHLPAQVRRAAWCGQGGGSFQCAGHDGSDYGRCRQRLRQRRQSTPGLSARAMDHAGDRGDDATCIGRVYGRPPGWVPGKYSVWVSPVRP